jgi:hypothetical protein
MPQRGALKINTRHSKRWPARISLSSDTRDFKKLQVPLGSA